MEFANLDDQVFNPPRGVSFFTCVFFFAQGIWPYDDLVMLRSWRPSRTLCSLWCFKTTGRGWEIAAPLCQRSRCPDGLTSKRVEDADNLRKFLEIWTLDWRLEIIRWTSNNWVCHLDFRMQKNVFKTASVFKNFDLSKKVQSAGTLESSNKTKDSEWPWMISIDIIFFCPKTRENSVQDACGDALILASSPQERQELLQAAANALRSLDGENVCGSLGEQFFSLSE